MAVTTIVNWKAACFALAVTNIMAEILKLIYSTNQNGQQGGNLHDLLYCHCWCSWSSSTSSKSTAYWKAGSYQYSLELMTRGLLRYRPVAWNHLLVVGGRFEPQSWSAELGQGFQAF